MKLLVFDGNSIINRAFYAIKGGLTALDGTPTNAIYGFLKLYFKYFEMSKPDMVAVAFDMRAPTFRHKIYDEYKAGRHAMPDELGVQFAPLKDILRAMNVCIFEKEGYEADDIIGTLSKYCTDKGYECDIVSGDRDDFQLVNDKVRVIMPVTKGGMSEVDIIDTAAIAEKYGIEPKALIQLKAVMGDSSDNIKGVPGIGEKGALALIQNFGSLDGIYENLDHPSIKAGTRKKLEEGRESAYLSLELATICLETPIEMSDDKMLVKDYDVKALTELFDRYSLNSFLKSLGLESNLEQVSVTELEKADARDYEYIRKNGLFFMIKEGRMLAFTDRAVEFTDYIGLITDDSIEKTTFKPKEIYKQLLKELDDIKPFYDIEVAQYVIDPSQSEYTLCSIAKSLIDKNLSSEEDTLSALSLFSDIRQAQQKIITQRSQDKLLFDIEFPLTVVLADMENCGFGVDKDALVKYSKKLEENIAALEKNIYFLAGEEFNINSPKQLGVVLFEILGLPHGKKTKTGYSTGAEVLQKLAGEHEIVDSILEYRQYVKLKSTYCDGLLGLIDGDGRIHSSFNQTVTQTGRISSTEPNLQNIPVRTQLGREMRAMFVAADDSVLVDADYSQIELRVLAHIADDKAMLDAFEREQDIHTVTAAGVFGVPESFVTSEMRRQAKAVNFGIVYGISDFSLSQDIGTTKAQAKQYIENYLTRYSGVKSYMKDIVARAKEDGYVTTLLGRRRYLPELSSSNFITRSFGERVALNTPIQGTAADIIKIAMVNTRRALLEGGYKAKLILQVHDELIIEAPENEKDEVMALLSREMQNAMSLNVKLLSDAQWGRTWYECK